MQTHRDPLSVISSISALTHHLRRLASDESSIAECAAQSCEEIVVGLHRGMMLRDSAALAQQRVIDVQFADFIRDPFVGDRGGNRYCWADTGLDAAQVRAQVRGYQQRYGVPDEPIR